MAEIRINVVGNSSKKVQEIAAEIRKLEALQKKKFIGDKTRSDKIDKSLERQRERLRRLTQGYKTFGTTVAAESTKAATGIAKIGKSASLATRLVTSLRTTMITTFGVFGVIRGVQNTINVFKDFEAAMASVRAITGAVGDDLKKLSQLAIDISKNGIFSAVEVANLEIKLAKLGFTIMEISNMSQGIVDLATATGEDLGTAAELTASTIRGLGLAATDTQMVVDQLGKSFVTSGLDIGKYRESIKFIAPIAREMGIELNTVVAILGKLADRQIFGSLAGTAFRRILIKLGDSTSEFSKRVGFTVKSSEDLLRAFKLLRDEGVGFAEMQKLVDVRSLTAALALKDNADALIGYDEEIKNANGDIREMAEIQLETLSAKLQLASNRWKGLILTMDEGNGVMSLTLKTILDTFSGALAATDALIQLNQVRAMTKEERDAIGERLIATKEQRRLEGLTVEELNKELQAQKNLETSLKTNNLFLADKENQQKAITAAIERGVQIQDILNKKESDALTKKLAEDEKARVKKLQADLEAKRARAELLGDKRKELKLNLEIAQLTAETTIDDEFDRRAELLRINAKYQTDLLKLEEGSAIKIKLINDKLVQDLEALAVKRTEFEEKERKNRLDDALKGLDEAEEQARAGFEVAKQQMIADGRTTEQIKKAEIEFEIILLEARIASTSALTGETAALKLLRKELEALQIASGNVGLGVDEDESGINKAKLKENARAFKQFASEFTQSMKSITDSIVDSADRRVDAVNNAISETQTALQIELALNKQGFASNVAAKESELNSLKAARERALEDQRKALAVQRTIENAVQAINLATAISALIKSFVTTLGPFGILASVGAGATLFAVFESLTKQATQVADKFEVGGWRELGGNRHSKGGVNLGEMGEAEKGEVVSVFNRGAVRKHKGLITNFTDMVNSGNFNMNHDVIGDVGREAVIVNSTVSLDDSKQIDKMNGLLEKSLTQDSVKMFGNNKVIRKGTKTRIIRG